ncbi:acetylornithine aminotransferase [Desulfosalsimonas propionicica]|uniref:Acetylornithine aminotransferase n=1 Tax=Desulfosalsimonas propionicica TaxID=332175 RepID=A0A7W0C7V8_9BACT|nr:acetylornithine transaminase [Desulfosalsimonas propionicica]MBA2880784.1 acetylornithine aminotransferase [Desulfosalsimonas propionicica]
MSKDYIQRADKVVASTYKRFPLVFERGRGCTLWDIEGRQYTDFVAGIAVCNLGHANPEISRALSRQADKLFHVSNLFYTVPQVELAEWLVGRCFADRVFFCNSGAEANEAAIKLARKTFFDQGDFNRWRIVAMDQSFHGRTFAALSATGQQKVREGFEPILEGFDFVAFNDIEQLAAAVTDKTCAVLLEPVQGEGGIRCADRQYLKDVRRLCDEKGIMLIFDEIQTGIGRTGKLFAHEHFDVQPDIMTLAKALGNGLPIGAMLATEKAAAAFTPGAHASTFGGTPVITAAALEVLRIIEAENILEHCQKVGDYFKSRLEWLKDRYPVVEEVRGVGLMLGMKLSQKGAPVVEACMDKGLLINCTQENVLRFVPPLVITAEEVDRLVVCLDDIFAGTGTTETC